jgi:hypothetical protein
MMNTFPSFLGVFGIILRLSVAAATRFDFWLDPRAPVTVVTGVSQPAISHKNSLDICLSNSSGRRRHEHEQLLWAMLALGESRLSRETRSRPKVTGRSKFDFEAKNRLKT